MVVVVEIHRESQKVYNTRDLAIAVGADRGWKQSYGDGMTQWLESGEGEGGRVCFWRLSSISISCPYAAATVPQGVFATRHRRPFKRCRLGLRGKGTRAKTGRTSVAARLRNHGDGRAGRVACTDQTAQFNPQQSSVLTTYTPLTQSSSGHTLYPLSFYTVITTTTTTTATTTSYHASFKWYNIYIYNMYNVYKYECISTGWE